MWVGIAVNSSEHWSSSTLLRNLLIDKLGYPWSLLFQHNTVSLPAAFLYEMEANDLTACVSYRLFWGDGILVVYLVYNRLFRCYYEHEKGATTTTVFP